MYRKSSRIILWIVLGVVVVLVPMSIYAIVETGNAREARCQDVVAERQLDRLLWFSIFERIENEGNSPVIDDFRRLVDEVKPMLKCNEQNIPVPDPPPSKEVP